MSSMRDFVSLSNAAKARPRFTTSGEIRGISRHPHLFGGLMGGTGRPLGWVAVVGAAVVFWGGPSSHFLREIDNVADVFLLPGPNRGDM